MLLRYVVQEAVTQVADLRVGSNLTTFRRVAGNHRVVRADANEAMVCNRSCIEASRLRHGRAERVVPDLANFERRVFQVRRMLLREVKHDRADVRGLAGAVRLFGRLVVTIGGVLPEVPAVGQTTNRAFHDAVLVIVKMSLGTEHTELTEPFVAVVVGLVARVFNLREAVADLDHATLAIAVALGEQPASGNREAKPNLAARNDRAAQRNVLHKVDVVRRDLGALFAEVARAVFLGNDVGRLTHDRGHGEVHITHQVLVPIHAHVVALVPRTVGRVFNDDVRLLAGRCVVLTNHIEVALDGKNRDRRQ